MSLSLLKSLIAFETHYVIILSWVDVMGIYFVFVIILNSLRLNSSGI